MVDSTNLRVEVAANGAASSNISLHNVADNLDGIPIAQDLRILISLCNDRVPLWKILVLAQKFCRLIKILQLDWHSSSGHESAVLGLAFGLVH